MARTIVTVPRALWRTFTMSFNIDWRGAPPSDVLNGGSVTVYNAFPRWVGSPRLYLNNAQIGQWEAIRATAQGRAGVYRVPLVNPVSFDLLGAGGGLVASGISFEGGAFFSDGSGWTYEPFGLAVGAVAAGSTQMRLDVSPTGVAPKLGQIMSHADWPFKVTWITEVSPDVYDIGVQMPLRRSIADGDTIQLEGWGLFEAVEDAMGFAGYDRRRKSTPQLQLREWINRA